MAKKRVIAAANKTAFEKAYIAATLGWQQMVREGKCGKGDACADAVARRHTMTLPSSCTMKITGRSLKHASNAGRRLRSTAGRMWPEALDARRIGAGCCRFRCAEAGCRG